MLKTKQTIQQALNTLNANRTWLAQESGLNRNTIDHVMNPDWPFNINIATAELIASALNCTVDEIDWPRSLSNEGRPPLSGVAIESTTTKPVVATCPGCNYVLPSSGYCGICE